MKRIISIFLAVLLSFAVLNSVSVCAGAEISDPEPCSDHQADLRDTGASSSSGGWSELYRDFILNKRYMSQKNGLSIYGNEYDYNVEMEIYTGYQTIVFMLYDFDRDGTPELIADSGYAAFSSPYMYVYTVKNGQMEYIMRLPFSYGVCYSDSPAYKGLFYSYGRQGGYYTYYADCDEISFRSKLLAYDIVKDYSDWDKGFDTTIVDQDLYYAYLDCTTAGPVKATFNRQGKNKLPYYNYTEINSMGWDSYIAEYGFSAKEDPSASWSSKYYDFLIKNKAAYEGGDFEALHIVGYTPLALRDLDLDGTPELIACEIVARGPAPRVYTIVNGEVVLAGGSAAGSACYSGNKAYPGLFIEYNGSYQYEYVPLGYMELSGGKVNTRAVMTYGEYDQVTYDRAVIINDKELYDAYSDEPVNKLAYSSWQDIENDGWVRFLAKFGYSSDGEESIGSKWLGTWYASNGEYIAVYSVSDTGLSAVFCHMTEKDMISVKYEMEFDSVDKTVASEIGPKEDHGGWEYTFILSDGRLTVRSRYPDKVFEKKANEALFLGDTDGDSEVSILDATAIQRFLADLSVSSFVRSAADADEDGEVTILDATSVQRHLADLPTNKNIGRPII